MPDKDKVIKGLECCSEKHNCLTCPYFCFSATCQDDMNRDALALLRGQKSESQAQTSLGHSDKYCKNCSHWMNIDSDRIYGDCDITDERLVHRNETCDKFLEKAKQENM